MQFLRPGKQPRGRVAVESVGTTCYANTVLQALYLTKNFRHEVIFSRHTSAQWSELALLFAEMMYTDKQSISAVRFLSSVKPPLFKLNVQNDSANFLSHLMRMLHINEHVKAGGRPLAPTNPSMLSWLPDDDQQPSSSFSQGLQDLTPDMISGTRKRRHAAVLPMGHCSAYVPSSYLEARVKARPLVSKEDEDYYVMDDLFDGEKAVVTMCTICHKTTNKIQMFKIMQLRFLDDFESPYITIQELINSDCVPQPADDMDDAFCFKCKAATFAQKEMVISATPKYLIIVVRNFRWIDEKHRKMNCALWCNNVIVLNTSLKMLEQSRYITYAVIMHQGRVLNDCHYFVLEKDGRYWYRYDNDEVTRHGEDYINSFEDNTISPYIIFLRRQDIDEHNVPEMHELPTQLIESLDDDY